MASRHDLYDTGNSLFVSQKCATWYVILVIGYALRLRNLSQVARLSNDNAHFPNKEIKRQSVYRLSTKYPLSESHYSTISEQQKR